MRQVIAVAALVLLAATCSQLDAEEKPSKAEKPTIYQDWPFDTAEAKRRQSETAQRLGMEVETSLDLGNGVKLQLVLIPAGRFAMGSPRTEKKRSDFEEQHVVTLTKAYWMGKYEVTQEEYERVMGKNPAYFKGARNPVEQVSWNDAQEFCQKLSKMTGREVRLPTEAEWEYTCRAGTSTPFHTGETISTAQANYDGKYVYGNGMEGEPRKKTKAVGSLAVNAFGLYDMHGNVFEFCGDRIGEYAKGEQLDPTGTAVGEDRMMRGSCWYNQPYDCRSASRFRVSNLDLRYYGFGIRVAMTLGAP